MALETVERVVKYISSYDESTKEILVLPIADADMRKELHQILETLAPWLGKTSFKSQCFPNYSRQTRLRCWDCGNSKSWPAEYHYGHESNNIDEYYVARCGDCGETFSWEPNFDDHDRVVRIYRNNCVILGKHFQTYVNDRCAIRPRDRKRMLAAKRHLELDKEALQKQLLALFDGKPPAGNYQTPLSLMQDFADLDMSKRRFVAWLAEQVKE